MRTRAPHNTVPVCPTCGWTGTRTTAGLAARSLRWHSCDKHRATLAATTRSRARDAAIDRTPRPCQHPVAHHRHGTYAAYTLDGCRCLGCASASSQYEQERLRRVAYGRTDWTDAAPVRDHVLALMGAGVGLKTVGICAGISNGALTKLVYGWTRTDGTRRPPAGRVRRTTAAALLAVRPDQAKPGARVDATGSRRRVCALIAAGWSVARISAKSGVDRQALDRLVVAGRWFTTGATAAAIRDTYTRLSSAAPPERTAHERAAAGRARARGIGQGWAGPGWWDEDTIDDPNTIEPSPGTSAPAPFDLDEWVHLVTGGADLAGAARRCGVTLGYVKQAAQTHSHKDALWFLAVHASELAHNDQTAGVARRLADKARAA